MADQFRTNLMAQLQTEGRKQISKIVYQIESHWQNYSASGYAKLVRILDASTPLCYSLPQETHFPSITSK